MAQSAAANHWLMFPTTLLCGVLVFLLVVLMMVRVIMSNVPYFMASSSTAFLADSSLRVVLTCDLTSLLSSTCRFHLLATLKLY